MIRPEYQNWKEYTGDSSQGMRQAAVPLWGSKNEVVAPKWRTQNRFFGPVLELVIKFAILVLNNQHQDGIFPEHLAPKSVLHLNLLCTQMAFCQNTFMWRAPKWQSSEHVWVWVIFWCQDGSRPYLINSHDGAFHKDSKSGLISKSRFAPRQVLSRTGQILF